MGEEERSRQADADQREVLDVAMEAGHILLENGAEIFRVEETIDRICHSFGVESEDAFVLSNGIFLTAGNEKEKRFARVKHIPVKGAQLDKVAAVNQLSRESKEMKYPPWGFVQVPISRPPSSLSSMESTASNLGRMIFACFSICFSIPLIFLK